MRTRVKICGITRVDDALAAVAAGADAIGLVFYRQSPRAVTAAQAAAICAALPPWVSRVGLFVNATADEIEAVSAHVRLDCLQFHGDETAQACAVLAGTVPYIKAIRMHDDVDVSAAAARYGTAQALLLDTYDAQLAGGTGRSFDWQRVPRTATKPLILAGGLTPQNVAAAIRTARPYAVDVSGGVEASKGIKDKARMIAFMHAVTEADS